MGMTTILPGAGRDETVVPSPGRDWNCRGQSHRPTPSTMLRMVPLRVPGRICE